jgi:hypothetical protein
MNNTNDVPVKVSVSVAQALKNDTNRQAQPALKPTITLEDAISSSGIYLLYTFLRYHDIESLAYF